MKLVALSGSCRSGSVNVKLAQLVVATALMTGIDAEYVDLRAADLPLYDGDLEARSGIPDGARRLKSAIASASGIFIASPEYNASITPLLKNSLDWLSRIRDPGEEPLSLFKARPIALGAATPGSIGGLRGLITLRQIASLGLGALVLPEQIAVPNAGQAFDEAGRLKDEKLDRLLVDVVVKLGHHAQLAKAA